MKKESKIIFFVILVAIVAVALVIFRYEKILIGKERDLKQATKVPGGVVIKEEYTASDILTLIKNSPEYLGDSVTIFESGEMVSSNDKFNGTLNNVMTNEGDMNMVKANMKTNKLPLQYNVYRIAAYYFRQQYPDEIKNIPVQSKDSTEAKQ